MTAVQRELGLKPKGLEKLRSALKDASHATSKALRELDVEYITFGRGRGAKSSLVKHQAA
jgi:hypothetical protein